MRRPALTRRARSLRRTWLAVSFACAAAGPLAAQVRPDTVPGDTLPRDTVLVPIPPQALEPDTLPADSLLGGADTLVAVPTLPAFPTPPRVGVGPGRWEWDREALRRLPGVTLLDVLGSLPGLVVARPGGFGRAATLVPWGLGGGRVRLLLDGYEVDPLGSGSPDLQTVSLVDLESVAVERTPAGVRVEVRSLSRGDPNPLSEVEAGTGTPETRVLRALFNRTFGSRSIATGTFDLASTEGWGLDEPYQQTTAALRWSYALGARAGVQAEFRHTGTARESELFPEDARRRDLVVRGRAEPTPGLVLEALAGRGTRTPESADAWDEALSVTQALARAAYLLPLGQVEASARWRDGTDGRVAAPALDLSARAALAPLPLLGVEGELRRTSDDTGGAMEWTLGARVSPLPAVALFAETSGGERLVGFLTPDSLFRELPPVGDGEATVDTVVRPRALLLPAGTDAWRAGAEARWGGLSIGGALVRVAEGVVVPPGALFDVGGEPMAAEAATGFEAFGSLAVPRTGGALRVEGWYARFTEVGGRPFLPTETARAALVYHDLRYDGQLEPSVRLEYVRRGSALVPDAVGGPYVRATEPYNLVNFDLQVRILDVRAFLRFENMVTVREPVEYLDRVALGQRILYGVRWQFRN